MRRQGSWLTILCFTASTVFLVAHSAPARGDERAGAVLDIKGVGAKGVRRFLEDQLEKRYNLVTRDALERAAEALSISKGQWTQERNLRRLARRAKVDVLITGYVYRARRRWWLVIQVRDGGTGRVVSKGLVPFAYFRLNQWTRKSLVNVLRKGMRKARGVPRPRRELVEPPRRVERKQPDPSKQGKPGDRPAYLTGFHKADGIEIFGRRLTFTNLEGQPGSRLLYETNAPVFMWRSDIEAYPGAFVTRHRVLANIGLGFTFRRAFGVVSQREGDPTKITTTIQRVGGRIMFRYNVWQTEKSPVLFFSLGVEVVEFRFGEDLGLVAGVQYTAFKPEIKAAFPLGTERVRLAVHFAGLGVLQLGQMSDAYHYGAARAGGVEASLEVDVRLFWRIHLLAGAYTSWFFVSFSQVGRQHSDYEYIADSATDGYFGGYLLLSVQY